LPRYKVKVTYIYPVDTVNARDAFSTVPMVMRVRLPMVFTAGTVEIFDSSTGELALKAEIPKKVKEVDKT